MGLLVASHFLHCRKFGRLSEFPISRKYLTLSSASFVKEKNYHVTAPFVLKRICLVLLA